MSSEYRCLGLNQMLDKHTFTRYAEYRKLEGRKLDNHCRGRPGKKRYTQRRKDAKISQREVCVVPHIVKIFVFSYKSERRPTFENH
jgi:hypothetical protein